MGNYMEIWSISLMYQYCLLQKRGGFVDRKSQNSRGHLHNIFMRFTQPVLTPRRHLTDAFDHTSTSDDFYLILTLPQT